MRAGEQRDPGADVGAAEHGRARARSPSMRGDRAVVLLGEDLGGRQQRRLTARVDHREHRPQRHDGLAGADLALQQPVHGVAQRQVGGDLAPTSCCPSVSRNGSRASKLGEHARRPRGARGGRQRGRAARRLASTVCSRNASSQRSRSCARVDLRPGLAAGARRAARRQAEQPVRGAHALGQRVRAARPSMVEDDADRPLRSPRTATLARPGRSGSARRRTSPRPRGRPRRQQLALGVRRAGATRLNAVTFPANSPTPARLSSLSIRHGCLKKNERQLCPCRR